MRSLVAQARLKLPVLTEGGLELLPSAGMTDVHHPHPAEEVTACLEAPNWVAKGSGSCQDVGTTLPVLLCS